MHNFTKKTSTSSRQPIGKFISLAVASNVYGPDQKLPTHGAILLGLEPRFCVKMTHTTSKYSSIRFHKPSTRKQAPLVLHITRPRSTWPLAAIHARLSSTSTARPPSSFPSLAAPGGSLVTPPLPLVMFFTHVRGTLVTSGCCGRVLPPTYHTDWRE